MKKQRYTAAYIIAFHCGQDMADMADCRYQPTVYPSPAVYTLNDDYYCAPAAGQKLPEDFDWREVGAHYSRIVYCSKRRGE